MKTLIALALATSLSLVLPMPAEAGCSLAKLSPTTGSFTFCSGPKKHISGGGTTQTVVLKGKVSNLKVVIIRDASGAVVSRTSTVIPRH